MNTAQKIIKNSSFLLIGEIFNAILGMLLVVYLARYLGVVQYGKYAFAFNFTSLFLVLSDLGLNVLSVREIARYPQKSSEYMTTIALTKLFLSFIMVSSIGITINLMHYPQDTTIVVYILGLVNILNSFSMFFRSIFRAFEKMEYDALTRLIERTMVTGFALVALFFGFKLIEIVLAIFLAQILAFILTFMICIKKFARPCLIFNFSLSRELIKNALPFGIASIFAGILFKIDTVMLSLMKGDEVVGWYNAAYQLVLGLTFIPASFSGSIYPVLSKYFISNKNNIYMVYQKSLKILFIMAISIGIGTTLIADRIIIFLYGKEFSNSAIILQILIWAVSFIFLRSIVGITIASINKQIIDTYIAGICTLLNIGLNLILIPKYSYIGAGIASVISQAIVFFLEFSYLQKYLCKIGILKMISKPFYASMFMGICIYLLDNVLNFANIYIFVIIFSAIFIYIGFLYLFKAFDQEELKLLKSTFFAFIPMRLNK